MIFFNKEPPFFGGGVFFYKLTKNPHLSIFCVCVWGGGGGGKGKGTCMNKCFKWHFFPSRRTPVQNYFKSMGVMAQKAHLCDLQV